MDLLSKFYFNYSKIIKTIKIYLLLAGPGMIVMIADNDAGGITTYAATGALFGFNLIWFLILLGPGSIFRAGNDSPVWGRHQARARGSDLQRVRLVLGLVLPPRPDARQLADDGH